MSVPSLYMSGGRILGSGGSMFSNATGGQAWQFSDLITGYTPSSGSIGNGTYSWGTQNDGGTANTATWNPSGLGNFLRINSPSGSTGVGTFGLRFATTATGFHEICVQYDIRRNTSTASKQCKTYGWGLVNTGNTSNATFGCTMGGYVGTTYGVYYGDVSTGSNDVSVAYATSGYPTGSLPNIGFGSAFSRTPYPTQTTTVASSQDVTGSVWETWMIYFLAASPSSPDGQIAIWKNNSLVMYETAMWNDNATTQDRGGFGLYEYSSNSGFFEDYRNVYMMFSRPVGMGI